MMSAGSANELFAAACATVLAAGKPVAPRGMATLEVLGASLCLTDPRRRFVDVPPVRVLNPAFAAAEAVWILSGSDAPWIYEYNRRLAEYTDDGRLMGAYGPRMRCWHGLTDQLGQVRELLLADPDSRRAVVQLFDPSTDFRGYKDVPCTLGYRFFLRDGLLHMHTTMRSQDLWLGFGYDIFTATIVQELLAGWLGVGLGNYNHQVDSLHLYERDLAAARRIPVAVRASPTASPLAVPWDDFDELLGDVTVGEQASVNQMAAGDGWTEIAAVLASYRRWKGGDRLEARAMADRALGPLANALCRWYDRLDRDPVSAAVNRSGENR